MAPKKLGEILIENGLVTEQQLSEALELQKVFPNQTVGQLLCKLGFLQESDLVYILEQSGKRQRLSDILINGKILDAEQTGKALEVSRRDDIPLHKAILKLNLLGEGVLGKIIAGQFDLSFVHIDAMIIEPDLARSINASYAQKQKIVPISRIGNTLTLAMSYPLKLQELKDLESTIRLRIIPVIAPESEIVLAHQRLYKSSATTDTGSSESANDLDISPDSIGDILSATGVMEEPDLEDEVHKVTERDSVIVKLVNKIIYDAHMNRASDIHFEPQEKSLRIRFRIDGVLHPVYQMPMGVMNAMIARIKLLGRMDVVEKRRPQDGRIKTLRPGSGAVKGDEVEMRLSTLPTAFGEKMVMRIFDPEATVKDLSALGFAPHDAQRWEGLTQRPHGIVLVTGPTGSGKTTTLYATLKRLATEEVNVSTVEDPIEMIEPAFNQTQVQTHLDLDFAQGLRALMRQDPDIIMVGEIRDLPTAEMAVQAALTGHLVFTTLHTNDAPAAIMRLMELGIPPYLINATVLGVLAQRLVRTLCPACRTREDEATTATSSQALAELVKPWKVSGSYRPYQPVGCVDCRMTGFRGRMGLYELLVVTDAFKDKVSREPQLESLRKQAVTDGMRPLRLAGAARVAEGLTTLDEVLATTPPVN